MTIKELTKELLKLTHIQDLEVKTEGCDCIGDIASIEYDGEDDYVLLKRTKE